MTAINVNTAFREFMIQHVRLDPGVTATARSSRDWLLRQIEALPVTDASFPHLYAGEHIHFGSFARRTKCRDLDDIDLIITMVGGGGTYRAISGTTCAVIVPDGHRLARFRDIQGDVNSRLVINQFIRSLGNVHHYRRADMKRNEAAAVLDLSSYSWVYDIVPAFLTAPEYDGRTYYLIPDGQGQWRKTDPQVDKARATSINQSHQGRVLDVIRLTKRWHRRQPGIELRSYLIETMLLDYYASHAANVPPYMDLNLRDALSAMAARITNPVYDPKNIDGDINHLDWSERFAAQRILQSAADACQAAISLEQTSQSACIAAWKAILGGDFGED